MGRQTIKRSTEPKLKQNPAQIRKAHEQEPHRRYLCKMMLQTQETVRITPGEALRSGFFLEGEAPRALAPAASHAAQLRSARGQASELGASDCRAAPDLLRICDLKT